MTGSPLLGALVGAVAGLGVVVAVAGWFGLLDRPATASTTPRPAAAPMAAPASGVAVTTPTTPPR